MLSSLRMHSIITYFQITNNDLYVENIKKPYQQLYLVDGDGVKRDGDGDSDGVEGGMPKMVFGSAKS